MAQESNLILKSKMIRKTQLLIINLKEPCKKYYNNKFNMAQPLSILKRKGILVAIIIIAAAAIISSGRAGISWHEVGKLLPFLQVAPQQLINQDNVRVVNEESVVIDVADHVSPSVVTVGISKTTRVGDLFEINPFDPFDVFRRQSGREQKVEQDIGSGFIIKEDGYIVTNKHVVSETGAKYRVITKDDKTYDVDKIYRDPVNDLAILKINATGLKTVELGDSSKLKVGQFVIAIGTALGEFRHTVTTGVISGLGRGITAGSPYEGYVEQLDNVIQTDAAINPGNSGGPLLNSGGQVIGVNAAIAAGGQNIGFAIPINVVKDTVENFNKTGQFSRPFIGVAYKIIGRDLAVLNEVPEGAYVQEVVAGSPADRAGVVQGDIITHVDGIHVEEATGGLAKMVQGKTVGNTITLKLWRNGTTLEIKITLGEYSG